jgi:hypothetical protein
MEKKLDDGKGNGSGSGTAMGDGLRSGFGADVSCGNAYRPDTRPGVGMSKVGLLDKEIGDRDKLPFNPGAANVRNNRFRLPQSKRPNRRA